MKLGRSSRRTFRYSIFIGILAGSVFSGSGAFAAVFEINTQVDLEAIGNDPTTRARDYILMSDLNLTPPAPEKLTYIEGTFTGTLDGNGKTLFGLTKPLFDSIGEAVNITEGGITIDTIEVKNLNLGNSANQLEVLGNGALANTLEAGATVNNVDVTGTVSGVEGVGGLVGSSSGTINNSSMNGEVTGSSWKIGGLVGILESTGTITTSNATGDVTGFGPDGPSDYIGGLVGWSTGSISSSSATGNVSGRWDVGGLVGYSSGDIANSHATGDVIGRDRVGGLVGQSDGVVTFSSAKGEVNSTAINIDGVGYHGELAPDDANGIGGLVGYNTGNITSSFTGEAETDPPIPSGNVTGLKNVGGLVGYSSGDITNSRATGDVNQSWACAGGVPCFEYIGGLVGRSIGDITSSWASGNVGGQDYVGGLVGSTGIAESVNITNSHATGNVTGVDYVGGLVGQLDNNHIITGSYARGHVTGDDSVGGLVGSAESGSLISNSYAKGNVTGNDDIGGLVGDLGVDAGVTNSYATGHVIGNVGEDGGDAGGLVGLSDGIISNSHASGDISGFYDVGGLVGDLQSSGSIRNSYATGNVRATGTDGDWSNGWGGLVGESSGLISNSYATGNVVADYNFGSLIGYLMINMDLEAQILNSFATGSTSRANNVVRIYETVYDPDSETYSEVDLDLDGLGGFVGCSIEGGFGSYSCNPDSYKTFPETTPSLLSVVNTEGTAGAPAFEIVACKNNGLPSLSELIDSYENTCVTLSGSNRERRIRDFIQTTAITEIAKTLGFVISSKFPNDAPIGFIKSEKDLAISKLLGLQKAADRVARTFVKTGEALQISYDSGGKEPIELWVKLADGKWILAGVINFDKNGKAVMPPIQFKVAGEYVVALNKPSEDSVKTNAPLNQIGSLTVIVN